MNTYVAQILEIASPNKYTKWYCSIIEISLIRKGLNEKIEKHHIIPKSFNIVDSRKKDNIVQLTLREHYICHCLLPKMFDDVILKTKMIYALWQMSNSKRYEKIINSRQYEYSRLMWLESRKNDQTISKKIGDAHRGKKKKYNVWNKGKIGVQQHTEKTKKKISEFQKNRPDCLKEKLNNAAKENGLKIKGKKHEEIYGEKSLAIKKKISDKLKGKKFEDLFDPEKVIEMKKIRSNKMKEVWEKRKANKNGNNINRN